MIEYNFTATVWKVIDTHIEKKKLFQITERFLRQSYPQIYGRPVDAFCLRNFRTFEIFAESRGFFDEARGVFIRQLNAHAICIFILRGRDSPNHEVRSVKVTTKRYKSDEFKSR